MSLADIYQSPLVVDIAIGFIVLESATLWAFHQVTGRGLAVHDFLFTVLSGLSLMLAMRCALTPGLWPGTALFLITAGLAHGADLRARAKLKEDDN